MSATLDKLVRMANQIAAEFENQQGAEAAAAATWDHLWHFWDPRMRGLIVEHLRTGGSGLLSAARGAVALLATGAEPASRTRATEFATDVDGNSAGDAG